MAGLTQGDMSNVLGYSRINYCYKENEVRKFSATEQEIILNVLNKNIKGQALEVEDVFPIE